MQAIACSGSDAGVDDQNAEQGVSQAPPPAAEEGAETKPAESTPEQKDAAPPSTPPATGRCATATVREQRPLKVMTINLRHDSDQPDRRLPLLAAEIARLDPDLIGMQEVQISKDQADKLNDAIKKITGKSYNLAQHRKPGLLGIFNGEGIGILSRFPIVKNESVDIQEYRVTQLARVKLPSGAEVDFFNTHLDYKDDGGDRIRLMEAKNTTKFIDQNETCNVKILTGDMNEQDDTPAVKHFVSWGLQDTYRAVNGDATKTKGNTFPIRLGDGMVTQNPDKRIDFILSKGVGPRVLKASASETYFKNYDAKGYYPSDHLGVMTTFDASL